MDEHRRGGSQMRSPSSGVTSGTHSSRALFFILLKLAYPEVQRPAHLPKVARYAGAPWHGLAVSAVTAYFP